MPLADLITMVMNTPVNNIPTASEDLLPLDDSLISIDLSSTDNDISLETSSAAAALPMADLISMVMKAPAVEATPTEEQDVPVLNIVSLMRDSAAAEAAAPEVIPVTIEDPKPTETEGIVSLVNLVDLLADKSISVEDSAESIVDLDLSSEISSDSGETMTIAELIALMKDSSISDAISIEVESAEQGPSSNEVSLEIETTSDESVSLEDLSLLQKSFRTLDPTP